MGHNFGMSHDFDNKHGGKGGPCDGQGIMSYNNDKPSNGLPVLLTTSQDTTTPIIGETPALKVSNSFYQIFRKILHKLIYREHRFQIGEHMSHHHLPVLTNVLNAV